MAPTYDLKPCFIRIILFCLFVGLIMEDVTYDHAAIIDQKQYQQLHYDWEKHICFGITSNIEIGSNNTKLIVLLVPCRLNNEASGKKFTPGVQLFYKSKLIGV